MSASKTHGMSRTPEWEAWRSMLKRCYKPNTRNYDRYGGRGISVCARWRESFANFFADMGPRPSKRHSLHRRENDGNYEKSNCEWATKTVQAGNRSRPRKNPPRHQRLTQPGSRPVNFKDITGQIFDRWEVIKYHGPDPSTRGGALWWCKCSCGAARPVKGTSLQTGRSKSCGCLQKEIVAEIARTAAKEANTQHGLSTTREYAAWNQMRQRCCNPNNPTYERYGALGVTVCGRWLEPDGRGFKNFLEDMGPCPTAVHTIDRKDPFGNYEKDNCRWATDEQQRLNQRRTRRYEFQGESLTLPELAARTGIRSGTLRWRLVDQGWTVDRATTTSPADYHHKHSDIAV